MCSPTTEDSVVQDHIMLLGDESIRSDVRESSMEESHIAHLLTIGRMEMTSHTRDEEESAQRLHELSQSPNSPSTEEAQVIELDRNGVSERPDHGNSETALPSDFWDCEILEYFTTPDTNPSQILQSAFFHEQSNADIFGVTNQFNSPISQPINLILPQVTNPIHHGYPFAVPYNNQFQQQQQFRMIPIQSGISQLNYDLTNHFPYNSQGLFVTTNVGGINLFPWNQNLMTATNGGGVNQFPCNQDLLKTTNGGGINLFPCNQDLMTATNGGVNQFPCNQDLMTATNGGLVNPLPYNNQGLLTTTNGGGVNVFPSNQDLLTATNGGGVNQFPCNPDLVKTKGEEIRYRSIAYLTDCRTTFYLNGAELPYAINTWDPNMSTKMNKQPSKYEYYVPPSIEDTDFFGGQHEMWQVKMMQHFGKFRDDIWRMQAVPDFQRSPADKWINFSITTKLRFCCRFCKVPWTSKKGKLLFAFTLDEDVRKGWIFLKMFGQVCMRKDCKDGNFQTPACYPEEINRAMQKVSDFIGYVYYGVPLNPFIFVDCEKSIRPGVVKNAKSHHRKELCQACQQGLCQAG